MPVLTYRAETWAVTEKRLNSLQAMKMRYLRKVEGKARRDRIRNTTIRAVSYTHLDVYKRQTI